MAFPLTQEQRNIVDDRGGELLVSAAAGSGKTRVLVERLLDRVTGEGLDIDRFLIITYTKAAAGELRSRIVQELAVRLAERPGDRHLRRQTTLVYQAQISTIHSFCAAFLRENGYLLDLDPDFRLCDEAEAGILMARTLEQVLDRRYEGLKDGDPFAQLADTLAAGRDDSRLSQIVLDIHGRIQSHPDPAGWLKEQKTVWELDGIGDLCQTQWGRLLLEDVRQQAEWCHSRMTQALGLCAGDELLEVNYAPSISATLESLCALMRAENWDGAVACLPVPFPALGRKKKRRVPVTGSEELEVAARGERVKGIRSRCKKQMEQVAEEMPGSSEELLEELRLSRPAVQALMDLVMDFQSAYEREKRRRSLVDFSDLEHFAVRLLVDEFGRPTALADNWAARYDEVMVDEYQDTNRVQNAIFDAVSRGGRTLFQVGDVKQSIYRFRLADPTIFLKKYHSFADGAEAMVGQPRRRVLSRNFRSRPEVLEGCNDLFRNIMSRQFGELDYTDDQALIPGADFSTGEGYALELDALDLAFLGEQEGEKENKDLLEARFVARRIRELLKQPLMLTEGEEKHPLCPSDIMVLLRSPGSVLHHYIQAFHEEGIPWVAEGGADFFQSTEVNTALSLLKIVDNPRQDVALIAALRSPAYGFSGDQLAQLRAGSEGDFYTAVVNAAQAGDEACQTFLDELADLRFGAGDRTCRQLIWHIYERTNLLGLFGSMEGGQERRGNLLALYALAGQLEHNGCRTLFQFLLRLERMRENGAKLTSLAPGQIGEGVSILSIHRSKGLEKPVVFVCGLTRRLNRDDLMRPVLFHPVLGVGPKGLDQERMVEYSTLARRAVARQLEREMMSEELRLLYVAMTRAKEKLILTLALPEGISALNRLGEDLSVPVSPMALESQQSVGQWILLHTLARPEAQRLRIMAGLPEVEAKDLGPAWDLRWVEGVSLIQRGKPGGRLADLPAPDEVEISELLQRLSWQYPHAAGANIPSKLTATSIKGRVLDREAAEEAGQVLAGQQKSIHRPNFIAAKEGLTPAQRGIALHQAMQYIPLEGDHTIETIRRELDRLEAEGFLTTLQARAVDPERICAFFASELGQRMTNATESQREFKFSLLVPAKDYYPDGGEDEILLQGVVDAWFVEEDGITILDFKSDRITPGGERARAEEYRPQLEAYQKALSAILNKQVKRCVLWFFATDCEFVLS